MSNIRTKNLNQRLVLALAIMAAFLIVGIAPVSAQTLSYTITKKTAGCESILSDYIGNDSNFEVRDHEWNQVLINPRPTSIFPILPYMKTRVSWNQYTTGYKAVSVCEVVDLSDANINANHNSFKLSAVAYPVPSSHWGGPREAMSWTSGKAEFTIYRRTHLFYTAFVNEDDDGNKFNHGIRITNRATGEHLLDRPIIPNVQEDSYFTIEEPGDYEVRFWGLVENDKHQQAYAESLYEYSFYEF